MVCLALKSSYICFIWSINKALLHYVVSLGNSYTVVPVQPELEPAEGRRWLSGAIGQIEETEEGGCAYVWGGFYQLTHCNGVFL